MRLRLLLAACVVVLVGGLFALLATRAGQEEAGDLGLARDPAFTAQLSGGLYDARTLVDNDGALDVAYLTEDAPLTAVVQAGDASGVATVRLRVDGHDGPVDTVACGPHRCPNVVTARLTPSVVARGTGDHTIGVLATTPHDRSPALVTSFHVNVGRRPAQPLEVEPLSATERRPAPVTNPAADRIIRAAARHGVLAQLLGGSRLVLRERGTGRGHVTVLADVRPTRRDVRATLPQFDAPSPAHVGIGTLRDLVLDVDVRSGRLLGIEPGPDSAITAWSPKPRPIPTTEGDDTLPTNFTARLPPHLLTLSDGGPAFFGQDGDPSLLRSGRDWPISLVFSGAATVTKVKAGLRRIGLVRRGGSAFLGYRTVDGILRFDGDRGLKSACDANGTDLHVRVYAPTATDRFIDPELGDVVLGTVHLDHHDNCGIGPPLFGFSERAERRLTARIARTLGWRVTVDEYPLGNGEPLRRDRSDPTHVWLADGRATGIVVP